MSKLQLSSLLFFIAACGGSPGTPTDADTSRDSGVPSLDGATRDGSITTDGAMGDASFVTDTGSTSDAGACEPRAGSMTTRTSCDLFELALLDDGEGNVEARLFGRLSGLPADGCATIDEVEVVEGGVTIGMLPGEGAFNVGDEGAALARGPAMPEMISRCGGDTDRFGGFGLIVRGRVDGGTFEARCADAEGGGRWPPALRITCHQNVESQPFRANYVSVESFDSFTVTSINVTMPHGPGGAILSVDSSVRVIPHAATLFGGAPVDPFSISGLDSSVHESSAPVPGTYSDIFLSKMGDAFGPGACPAIPAVPELDDPPSPVMILRLTGTGDRGAFSTEAYVNLCDRISR